MNMETLQNIGLHYLANQELPFLLLVGLLWWGLYYLAYRKTKNKFLFILFLTIFYGFLSFYHLGSSQSPQSSFYNQNKEDTVTLDFEKRPDIHQLYVFSGQGKGNKENPFRLYTQGVEVYQSTDQLQWDYCLSLTQKEYAKWAVYDTTITQRYVQLRFSSAASIIHEIGFYDEKTQTFLTPKILQSSSENAENLLDEQTLLKTDFDYRDGTYFDEIYHVRNANEIANGWLLYTAVHPLLGTRLLALGISLWGMNPLAYRFFAALCSTLLLPLFWLLAKALFSQYRYSNIAAILWATDFMPYTTGRIATLEPFSLFWILIMYYFMLRFCQQDLLHKPKKSCLYLWLSGISMSLAWATKWTTIYASVGLAILFFHSLYKSYQLTTTKMQRKIFVLYILCACLAFVILPIYVYIYSYYGIHFYPTSAQNFFDYLRQLLNYTNYAFTYHRDLHSSHPFAASWYMWLFDIRPIWYYVKYTATTIQTISCFNNPAINLFGLYAIFQIFYRKYYKKAQNFLPLIAYFVSLLAWVPISRETFAYHYYPSLPFLILLIVSYLKEREQQGKNKRFSLLYIGVCCLLWLIFLPVISGFTTLPFYVQKVLPWLPSWYFG